MLKKKVIGIVSYNYSSGNIWKIEEYKMGVPEGDWVYYYNNAGTNALERI